MSPHTTQNQPNFTPYDDLINEMSSTNKYDHLKVILNTSHDSSKKSFQKYLWATPYDFGIARLLNVDYNNDQVILRLRDEINDINKTISIDINVPDIKVLLINFEDLKNLISNHQ